MNRMSPRYAALVFFVIALAFVMRAVFMAPEVGLSVDNRERYERLALNIQEGNGLSKVTSSGYKPDDFDQPGYPYGLAAVYSLPMGGHRAVALIQLLFELATLLLVFLICRRLELPRTEQIAALGIGLICPFLPLFSNMIMTEVPATFLVTLGCYFLVTGVTTADAKWWVLAGLASGAALLIRADIIIAVSLMAASAILLVAPSDRRKALSATVLFGLSITIVLMPWMVRNYRLFREPRPLGGTAGQTHSAYVDWLDTWADDPIYLDRYWWNALNSTYPPEFPAGKLAGDEKQRAENALVLARTQRSFSGEPMQVFAELAEKAKHDRPWRSSVIVPARRLVMTWVRMPFSIESTSGKRITYVFWIGFLGLGIIGLWVALTWPKRVVWIPIMMVVGRAALPLLSFLATEPRYMLEALPACFILGALGLGYFKTRVGSVVRENDYRRQELS